MKIHLTQLKQQARQAMAAARPGAWRMSLVYLFLTSGVSMLLSLFVLDPLTRLAQLLSAGLSVPRALMLTLSETGWLGLFLYILSVILILILDFSYQFWCLGTTRSGRGEWSDLFYGLTMSGRVVLLRLTVLLYCFVLSAGIFMLASLISSVAMFTSVFGVLAAIPLFIAAFLFAFWRILHYSLASYCMMDKPLYGASVAISESRELMRGHCGQFLLLSLSFLGWAALGVLIQLLAEGLLLPLFGGPLLFGGDLLASAEVPLVGVLATVLSFPFYAWLTCYYTMSICCFYNTLRGNQPQP